MRNKARSDRPLYGDTEGANTLAQRLAQRRAYYGWTQADVEQRSGIDRSYVSLLESGDRPRVSMAVVSRLAEALETTPAYLWGLTEDPRPLHERNQELTALEAGLLDLFRMLPEGLQRLAIQQLDLWLDHRDVWEAPGLNGEDT